MKNPPKSNLNVVQKLPWQIHVSRKNLNYMSVVEGSMVQLEKTAQGQ
jgi:hypothetical protein